jgi:cytochrome c556
MLRFVALCSALVVGVTASYAQNLEVIKQRRAAMGAIAKASTPNFQMMKGEAKFDLAAVQANMKTMQAEAEKLKSLFPDDSKTGGDTDASPKIWQDKAGFNGTLDGMIAALKSAAGAIKDEASLKTEYPKVARSCGGCHKDTDGFAPSLSQSFKRLQ